MKEVSCKPTDGISQTFFERSWSCRYKVLRRVIRASCVHPCRQQRLSDAFLHVLGMWSPPEVTGNELHSSFQEVPCALLAIGPGPSRVLSFRCCFPWCGSPSSSLAAIKSSPWMVTTYSFLCMHVIRTASTATAPCVLRSQACWSVLPGVFLEAGARTPALPSWHGRARQTFQNPTTHSWMSCSSTCNDASVNSGLAFISGGVL